MATTKNNWSTDRISNMVMLNLINFDPEYPWHFCDPEQFEQILPKLILTQNKEINIIIHAYDCQIQFNTDAMDLKPNLTFITDDITFKVYLM